MFTTTRDAAVATCGIEKYRVGGWRMSRMHLGFTSTCLPLISSLTRFLSLTQPLRRFFVIYSSFICKLHNKIHTFIASEDALSSTTVVTRQHNIVHRNTYRNSLRGCGRVTAYVSHRCADCVWIVFSALLRTTTLRGWG